MDRATPTQRRRVLLAIIAAQHRALGSEEDRLSYTRLHSAVQELQPVLRSKQGLNLGYEFKERKAWGTIDRKLQLDLEILQAKHQAGNDPLPIGPSGAVSHHNRPKPSGAAQLARARRHGWWEMGEGSLEDVYEAVNEHLAEGA